MVFHVEIHFQTQQFVTYSFWFHKLKDKNHYLNKGHFGGIQTVLCLVSYSEIANIYCTYALWCGVEPGGERCPLFGGSFFQRFHCSNIPDGCVWMLLFVLPPAICVPVSDCVWWAV